VPKSKVKSWTGYPGGAPCNVACGLGLLDVPVAFVSCLGQDKGGDELVELMTSELLSCLLRKCRF
jgi:fructokinase